MKLVCISDTHGQHAKLTIPECDILIHTGDWSFRGSEPETKNFAKWLSTQPATDIVVIPGNHEQEFETNPQKYRAWLQELCPRAHLLIHEALDLNGLKFFGSPWTPYFHNWAWNAGRTITEAAYYRKPFIGDLWQDIPLDTQILLTHGPGLGTLDRVFNHGEDRTTHVGCPELSSRLKALTELKIHAFGHLHLDGGKAEILDGVVHINASTCDDDYKIHQARVVKVEL